MPNVLQSPEASAQELRQETIQWFLFGSDRISLIERPEISPQLRQDLRPSYPAYNLTRVVPRIEHLVRSKPDNESSPGPNERLIPGRDWLHKKLRLFARGAVEEESPETQHGELARVDYVKVGRRLLLAADDELDLKAGLYTQTENFFVDAEGQAQFEKALAHGLRFKEEDVVLRDHIPATLIEMKNLLKALEDSEQAMNKVPVLHSGYF